MRVITYTRIICNLFTLLISGRIYHIVGIIVNMWHTNFPIFSHVVVLLGRTQEGSPVEAKEFSRIRHYLGKTQKQLARLLCVSPKTVESFEEGWRNIPTYAERQLLLLLSLKRAGEESTRPCWDIVDCPAERRKNCVAWEYNAGFLCWFVSGTFCQGEFQGSWDKKMHLCRQCEVFRAMIPPLT